jgi:hypothetical protein
VGGGGGGAHVGGLRSSRWVSLKNNCCFCDRGDVFDFHPQHRLEQQQEKYRSLTRVIMPVAAPVIPPFRFASVEQGARINMPGSLYSVANRHMA